MRRFANWIAKLRGTLRPRPLESRLDDEIQFHLEMHAQRAIRDGVSPEAARRDALVAFGGREPWREAARDEIRDRTLEGVWQDARYAVRTLRKSPAFSIVALATVVIGIGATTAVFSVVSGILLRPLPFVNPNRLASIWPSRTISNAELEYLQQNAKSFVAVAAFSPGWGVALTGSGEPQQLNAARVSTNFFTTLGARALAGRTFGDGESSPGTWSVAVLSHSLWSTQFGRDSTIIGRIVQMDGVPTRVIGVMPADFEAFQAGVDTWLPLQIDRSSRFYTGQTALGFGRLASGATFATATTEMATLAPRMRAAFEFNDDYGRGGTVVSLHESLVGNIRQSLLVLLGAVAFVLLIAGANVSNLLLVHATGRHRELAVRRALGASRAQIARQLLVQSGVIALVGGVFGTALGVLGVRGLKAVLPATLPMLSSVAVDWRVLAVSALITLLIGVAFGLTPARTATRVDPEGALRSSTTGGSNRASATTRRSLVVAEIALAMVLVVGAGLMAESLRRLSRVDLGFDARNVLSFRIQPTSGQVTSAEQTAVYFDEMLARIAALPGVERVGGVQHLPLTGFNWRGDLDIESHPLPPAVARPRVVWRSVIGDYFGAMRIPLRRGRLFLPTDTRAAPPVVVINEAAAKQFWPGRDPIGERIKVGTGSRNEFATIVGIVGNVRFASPNAEPGYEVYRPNAQQGLVFMHFVVRAKSDPLAMMPSIRTAIRSLDGNVPIASVRALEALYSASTATPRTIAQLLLAFAAVGLLLAAIGIYGVIAYSVGQRTRELGIRTALGALEGRIVMMVVNEGLRLTLVGLAIGIVAAVFASRSLNTLVFGVTTTDVSVYAAVAALLALVAITASYIPARRASRVDPLIALRSD
jgi:putative ABC transport system permease protein